MHRGLVHLVLCMSFAALPAAPGRAHGQGAGTTPAHYLVVSLRADGTYELLFHRRVGLAGKLASRREEDLALAARQAGMQEEVVPVALHDRAGRTVFREVVRVPRWIRGEFHGEPAANGGWTIEEHRFPWEPRVFVVRVPAVAGTTLLLGAPGTAGKASAATFDLDAVEAAGEGLPLAAAMEEQEQEPAVLGTAAAAGDPANRVDLLILGDGYTADEASKFAADVANLEASFFDLEPYSTYENFVNAVALFTASAQSGADHPPYNPVCVGDNPACCADGTAISDPKAGTYVDTAFGGRYCAFNIHRLAVVDGGLAIAAAAAYPDWDRILVLINDDTYGGSGGFLLTASTHPAVVDVARHEYGHSFTHLADEYETAFPGYPACSDVTGPFCEANVTDQTSRPLVKWLPWIKPSTPVPTPEGVGYTGAGLFHGARYRSTGMYRHRDSECLMNFLGKPFGEVCSQEYVLQLYQGGWGEPAAGIDSIEPGRENPPPGPVSTRTGVYLSVGLLQPLGGSPLDVVWKVDDTVVPDAKTAAFGYFTTDVGSHQVRVEVRDTTPLVHPDMAGTALESEREWTVTTSGTTATSFYTLTPCRVIDTRRPAGPHGGPALSTGVARAFALAGQCGIPEGAKAVSANVTVTQPTASGHLVNYPQDTPTPQFTSTFNFSTQQTRSNNAIIALGDDASGTVVFLPALASGTVHLLLDVNGYYR